MKKLSALLSILVIGVFVYPAQAGRVEPKSVSCWFFRGEKLELQQTCIYEAQSWAGGGVSSLRWEDGVETKMARGFQGRGEKPCGEDTSIDGVCGVRYFRDPTTLKRISEVEQENRERKSQPMIFCVQVRDRSVCWL